MVDEQSHDHESMRVRFQEYLDERKMLVERHGEQEEVSDKWILTIAGGGLGLSVTFVQDIAGKAGHPNLMLLGGSWLCLVLAVLVGLFHMRLAANATERSRQVLDEVAQGGSSDILHDSMWKLQGESNRSQWIGRLNWGSLFLVMSGVVFMCWFALDCLAQSAL